MYANRQRHAVNPAGLGAALTINAAALAALWFAPPDIVKKYVPRDFIVRNIPVVPPPDPLPPEPRPEPRRVESTVTRPVVPKPVVEPLPRDPIFEVLPTRPLDPGPSIGDGDAGGGATLEPPRPEPPTLVEAQPDPRFARDFQPPYPPSELRAQREGAVALRITIGIDGRVRAVDRVSATSDAFFEAARRQAMSRWRFKPATRGGVPVESSRVMRVSFVLDD